jgi:hypothetical protein
MIRQAGGHFCKCEKGTWFEVGDRCAREKVSAYFRDMLHTQYRSSAKAKTTLRRDRNRNKSQTQTQQHCQQLVDGAGGHISDDSSMSSSCWGSSLDFQSFLLDDDFFDIDVFNTDPPPRPKPPFGGFETEVIRKHKLNSTASSSWSTALATATTRMIPQCRRHAGKAA